MSPWKEKAGGGKNILVSIVQEEQRPSAFHLNANEPPERVVVFKDRRERDFSPCGNQCLRGGEKKTNKQTNKSTFNKSRFLPPSFSRLSA